MSFKRIIIIILLTLVCSSRICGAENMIVLPITANEGLSNNTVWAVLQDKSGFIWIGTVDGLDRYDGNEIRHFAPDSLIGENNSVLSLCEDDCGRVWVGTNSGICYYEPSTDREYAFRLRLEGVEDGGFQVYQIIKAGDGTLWIPAGKYGFIQIDPCKMEARQVQKSADGSTQYFGGSLCFDGRETFYLTMEDGNIYSSADQLASVSPLYESPILGSKPRYLRYAFGYLFTGSADEQLKIDLHTKKISKTPWAVVRESSHSHKNELITSNQAGLHILDANLQEKEELNLDMNSRLAFQSKSIMCACRDRDGNIWAGTYYSGVFHLIQNKTGLQQYYPKSVDDDEPSHVREIVPDQDGTVWVATEDRGLLRMNPQNGVFQTVRLPLSALNIQALCNDGDYLWIGAYARTPALAQLNKKSGKAVVYEDAPRMIFSICKLRGGGVAIGSSSGLGLFRNGKFNEIQKVRGVVQEITEDRHGHVWISTGRDGLWCCLGDVEDPRAQWVHYTSEGSPDSLPSNKVTSVFEDSESRIWVTTEGGGFCLLLSGTGGFKRYSDYNVCYKISEDKTGLLWITTSKGLLCFNPEAEVASLLTRDDGMLSNQYNYSSNVISREGVLYAGSGDGLICFAPDKIMQSLRNSSIMLTGFEILSPRAGKAKEASPDPQGINMLKSVTLRHKYNSFRVKVSTDNYDIPGINRLQYYIEGVDNEWADVNGGVIEVNKLKTGRYCLHVRVMRLNGVVEPDERTLGITIKPHVLASLPALVAYILLMVAFMLLFKWWITKRMKEKQAGELLDAQKEFVTVMAHEIKTPLTLVKVTMESFRDTWMRQGGKPRTDILDVAFRNLDRISELVSQLQDFSSLESYEHSLEKTSVNMSELLNQIFSRFSLDAKMKDVELSLSLPESDIFVQTNRDAIDKIATNLLSNALKYAKSFARINLYESEGKCCLEVVNDGITVPEGMSKSIFEPFVRYSDNSQSVPGMGIGLSTSKKLSALIGAELIYRTSKGNLNSFLLTISMKGATPAPVPESPGKHTDEADKKTILVVEDNPEMLSFLAEHLSEDYRILKAAAATDAISMLESGSAQINMIISDVMMPGMDGFEFCKRVKDNILTSHLPILLLTAKTDIGSKVEGLHQGADMYLEKPFSLEHLKAAISSVFANREQMRKYYLSHPFDKESWPKGDSADSAFISRLVQFVENNIEKEDLRVSDIAEATFVSESHLYKKTKALLNMSPLEYVQHIRLKMAESMLLGSDIPVSEIGFRVGFSSHSYFSACFKKQYGMSPSRFREEKTL